jgi:hypothetical protein
MPKKHHKPEQIISKLRDADAKSALWLSHGVGVASPVGLASESKTNLSTLGARGAESAAETAKTTAFGPQREQLRSTEG